MKKMRLFIKLAFAGCLVAVLLLTTATMVSLRPPPEKLEPGSAGVNRLQVLDRSGLPLSRTYQNSWNYSDQISLYQVPLVLQQAFIQAEDKRFYAHTGIDWLARSNALLQNIAAGRVVRGASTISEQVVRMLQPRPRTFWSRWLEGWEAQRLENAFSKGDILAFYLNQVPYAGQRRGVRQAARYYFDRDLSALSRTEYLALAVMIRAPGKLSPSRGADALHARVQQLASRMQQVGLLSVEEVARVESDTLSADSAELTVDASHYVRFVLDSEIASDLQQSGKVTTTLESGLQLTIQGLLNSRLAALQDEKVSAGAVLVANWQTGEILAWVNGRASGLAAQDQFIDAVLAPRQPGSALKPFLYALAMEKGWHAATLLNDAPLAGAIGQGQHNYQNYSRHHYGPIRLRVALGNSLNIPAVLAAKFVEPQAFLQTLHQLGFESLDQSAEHYGLGLALGNGEVSLFEMVQAYMVLAANGSYSPLRALHSDNYQTPQPVFSAETTSLIASILSDPEARQLEFGSGSLLNLPVQTAVKTGTSSDYRDAWSVGFNHQYVVGVWMGNLDRSSMFNITGSTGPALVLRGVFAELNRWQQGRPLYLSPKLARISICRKSGHRAGPDCHTASEWFKSDQIPELCDLAATEHDSTALAAAAEVIEKDSLNLLQPTAGLQLAKDPRIPDNLERFAFQLPEGLTILSTEWVLNGSKIAETGAGERSYLWPLAAGQHAVYARIQTAAGLLNTSEVNFLVK